MAITPFDLSQCSISFHGDGSSARHPAESGPPPRVDGLLVGAPHMTRNAPHAGEMHPDGDELLVLVSGRVDVILEVDGTEQVAELNPGQSLLVPRGVWHRVDLREPSQVIFITPGPDHEHRPLPESVS